MPPGGHQESGIKRTVRSSLIDTVFEDLPFDFTLKHASSRDRSLSPHDRKRSDGAAQEVIEGRPISGSTASNRPLAKMSAGQRVGNSRHTVAEGPSPARQLSTLMMPKSAGETGNKDPEASGDSCSREAFLMVTRILIRLARLHRWRRDLGLSFDSRDDCPQE